MSLTMDCRVPKEIQKDLFTVYQLNFIRQHGSQTQAVNPDQVVSDHCPNCGAPLKSLQLASVTTVVPISLAVQTNGY